MVEYPLRRAARVYGRALLATLSLATPLAFFAPASPAVASVHHPTGEFVQFADCPLSHVPLDNCLYGEMGSGALTVGKRTIPIDRTLTIEGGFFEDEATEELVFVGAEDGNTFSKTPLSVPGGLQSIVNQGALPRSVQGLFNETVTKGAGAVTLTAELAGPASTIKLSTEHLIVEEGVGLQLPLKIRLNNPFLGTNCYVGSSTNPIVLSMTTGTTTPPPPNKLIKGSAGVVGFNPSFDMASLTGSTLVDNTFTAPRATGCSGSFSTIVDPVVDQILGLPSPAGYNTAVLHGVFQVAVANSVKASE